MKTRIKNISSVAFSFQYAQGKRPGPRDWRFVGGFNIKSWPTLAQRDRARAMFSGRRTVEAAIADLKASGLLP
jgi:hypothetical protein